MKQSASIEAVYLEFWTSTRIEAAPFSFVIILFLVSLDYQKKKVVGLERGPLSLVSTTEELLDRKVAAPV
jgi:hypothetical protein